MCCDEEGRKLWEWFKLLYTYLLFFTQMQLPAFAHDVTPASHMYLRARILHASLKRIYMLSAAWSERPCGRCGLPRIFVSLQHVVSLVI